VNPRLRGLKDLVQDAVDAGATAIERVHRQAAARPFALLEKLPALAVPARGVHEIHDAVVTHAYGMVRLVNRVVRETTDAALDAAEKHEQRERQRQRQRSGDGDDGTAGAAPGNTQRS
jgi:hypothetical protein